MLLNQHYQKFEKLTKNFKLSEFHCKDGTLVPQQYLQNVIYVAVQLQKIRDALKLGFLSINSAYRTKLHNSKIGGATNSNHLTAQA